MCRLLPHSCATHVVPHKSVFITPETRHPPACNLPHHSQHVHHSLQATISPSSGLAIQQAAEPDLKRLWFLAIKPPMYNVALIPILVSTGASGAHSMQQICMTLHAHTYACMLKAHDRFQTTESMCAGCRGSCICRNRAVEQPLDWPACAWVLLHHRLAQHQVKP